MFKNRTDIDKLILDEGRIAETDGECAVEKRFASENRLALGDTIKAGGEVFRITGIGAVPDYDQLKAKFSDTAVQSRYFGLIFVTDECYDKVRSKGGLPAEKYVYAYKLGNSNTTLTGLLEAYTGCGGTLKNLNVPLEESAALLGTLADRGIKASEAGTAFRTCPHRLKICEEGYGYAR